MVPTNHSNGMSQMQRINFQTGQATTPNSTSSTNATNASTTVNSVTTSALNANTTIANSNSPVQATLVASAANTPNSEDGAEEEPLYVNAKQYNRILKRRLARAKLENDGRIPKNRQVSTQIYLNDLFVLQLNTNSRHFCLSRGNSCTNLDTSMR